jgi:hypothetical protein
MKVVVLHGSFNKLTFKTNRKWVFSKSKLDFKIFLIQRFSKRVSILNVFILSHLLC